MRLEQRLFLLRVLFCILLIIAFVAYLSVDMYFLPKTAVEVARDSSRIRETCGYFYSKYDAKFYNLIIDGELHTSDPYPPKEFPFWKKRGYFYRGLKTDRRYCHRIKVVYVEWLIWKKTYIYDVMDVVGK